MKKIAERKNYSKKIMLAVLILFLIAITLLILGFQKNKKYEFYDFNGNFGTSPNCEIKSETLICDVNGYDIPVSQYSRIS